MEDFDEKQDHTWTIIGGVIYVGLLLYFGWQTWQFVTWLFPQDQLAMKCLSLLSFDIMAFLWACIDLFDRNDGDRHKPMVLWAWGISFALSLIASVLYLVIANMLRFSVPIDQGTVDTGEAITIIALTLNILFLTFWLYGKMDKSKKPRPSGATRIAPAPVPVSVPVAPPAHAPVAPQPAPAPALTAADVLQIVQAAMAQRPAPQPQTAPVADPYEDLANSVKTGPDTSPLAVAPPNGASQNGHKAGK